MKNFYLTIKKYWFPLLTVILTISFIFIHVSYKHKIFTETKDNIILTDAKTLHAINPYHTTERMSILQIETIYNFYKELGYNLQETKYTPTRQEISYTIQKEYTSLQQLEDFLYKHNLELNNFKILQDNFKKSKSALSDFQSYSAYKKVLIDDVINYIYENNLIDINKEKELIKQETGLTNDIEISEILTQKLIEKIYEIIQTN